MTHVNAQRIKWLMRKHHVTISGLATRLGVTQKRVRHVREEGVIGHGMVASYLEAIQGREVFNRHLYDRDHAGQVRRLDPAACLIRRQRFVSECVAA